MMSYVTMDYKFLNKVVWQLVSETMIDYDMEIIYFPYVHQDSPVSINLPPRFSIPPIHTKPSFDRHCKGVYGLNVKEIEYIWDQFRQIIKDKINNGL